MVKRASKKKRPQADEVEAAFQAVEFLTGGTADDSAQDAAAEAELRSHAASILRTLGGAKGARERARPVV